MYFFHHMSLNSEQIVDKKLEKHFPLFCYDKSALYYSFKETYFCFIFNRILSPLIINDKQC